MKQEKRVVRESIAVYEASRSGLKLAGLNPFGSVAGLVQQVSSGIPFSEFGLLADQLGITQTRLQALMRLSPATIARRKKARHFEAHESDVILRYRRLLAVAARVLGTDADARLWLASPQFILGGAIPLEYAMTEVGARAVEESLLRAEDGVFA